MNTSIVAEKGTVQPSDRHEFPIQLGRDYEVAGDGAVWQQGRALTGVFLNEDGAWAGQVRNDGHGAWVDLMDADGDLIPARQDWESYIVREVPAIGPAFVAQQVAA